MARKSRKFQVRENEEESGRKLTGSRGDDESLPAARIPTAIYARLSAENNGREDGDSLNNQIALVRSYLEERANKYEVREVYADNGFSGTNFDRPEFERMMDDAWHGRIGCIAVKDLSRFGRNYVETGTYVESVLPKLNVSLIAVNDRFDSSREEDRMSVTVPLKNMINESYAREQSRKLTASHRIRNARGDAMPGGFNPYGYKRNAEGKGYVPDENADYVRAVFYWAAIGVPPRETADRLNVLGAPTPRESQGRKGTDGAWNKDMVKRLLYNPVYAGRVCLAKSSRARMGTGAGRIRHPRSEWITRDAAHEPMTSLRDYEALAAMRDVSRKNWAEGMAAGEEMRNRVTYDFKDVLYCGECNKKMMPKRKRDVNGENLPSAIYECAGTLATGHAGKTIRVSNDFLRSFVMRQTLLQVRTLSDRARLLRKLKGAGGGRNYGLSIDKRMLAAREKLTAERNRHVRLYEDFREGLIGEEDFRTVNEGCIQKEKEAEEALSRLGREKDAYVRAVERFLSVTDGLVPRPERDGFDGELMRKMVERVDAYDGNRFEVTFRTEWEEELIRKALEDCDDKRGDLS